MHADEESGASIGHHRDKTNYVGPKEKVHNFNNGLEDGTSSKPKLQLEPTNNSKKRKSKPFSASQDVAEEV
ncbi:hypothetical protein V6N12_041175 [Hibiscus sabdariffa]|uniref:Uncharacterized protein n=1 Tax=Hibiscus sabdariffa TaxID=183260 RepID=A0ABR2E5Z0_9ROSI